MTKIQMYYEAEAKTYAAYREAKAAGNEAGITAAREAHEQLMEQLNAEGSTFGTLYRMYEDMMETGNELIDIHDVVWDKDVAGLLAMMRENGIDRFTFSSTWSSAVATAWLFTRNGCHLEGLIEINSNHKDFVTDEYEKIPAYVFSI